MDKNHVPIIRLVSTCGYFSIKDLTTFTAGSSLSATEKIIWNAWYSWVNEVSKLEKRFESRPFKGRMMVTGGREVSLAGGGRLRKYRVYLDR